MSLLPWYFCCWWHAESSLSSTNYEGRDNPNVPKTIEIVVAFIAKNEDRQILSRMCRSDDENRVWIVSMSSKDDKITADYQKVAWREYPNLTTGGLEKYGSNGVRPGGRIALTTAQSTTNQRHVSPPRIVSERSEELQGSKDFGICHYFLSTSVGGMLDLLCLPQITKEETIRMFRRHQKLLLHPSQSCCRPPRKSLGGIKY
jgi:hypothetical protein